MQNIRKQIVYYCLMAAFVGSTLQFAWLNRSWASLILAIGASVYLFYLARADIREWLSERERAEKAYYNLDQKYYLMLQAKNSTEDMLERELQAHKTDLAKHAQDLAAHSDFVAKATVWNENQDNLLNRYIELRKYVDRRQWNDASSATCCNTYHRFVHRDEPHPE